MTNGRRKQGKHSAALPETQPAGARETEAKTVVMTNRELEEKFATKEELKHSEKFLVVKTEQEIQLLSQQMRSMETNLTQKIDANEARSVERIDASETNLTQKIDASETNLTQKIDANEARADEFRSDMNRQFEASQTNLTQKIDANEARSVKRTEASEARSVKRTEASEARIIEKLNEFKSEVFKHFAAKDKINEESTKRLESTIEQQSEKNLYKTAFLVVIIGASLSGLTYGVYQLVKFLTGG